jgi:hypothetical protein
MNSVMNVQGSIKAGLFIEQRRTSLLRKTVYCEGRSHTVLRYCIEEILGRLR